jgi:carboxylate-amine ligase
MQAMLTYGPDINLSLPEEMGKRLDLADLELKINHYAPAMAAFSLASPFYAGDIWKVRGRLCKTFRTHRRSTYAPAVELHPSEHLRLEFKPFEMSWRLQDFENYFLLFLTLVLDDSLEGRASNQMRIYDLGAVARWGFYAEEIASRAEELLTHAPKVLKDWGFDPKPLASFEKRAYFRKTPADELIDRYAEADRDLATVLRSLTSLEA